jgi:hypothetical protein
VSVDTPASTDQHCPTPGTSAPYTISWAQRIPWWTIGAATQHLAMQTCHPTHTHPPPAQPPMVPFIHPNHRVQEQRALPSSAALPLPITSTVTHLCSCAVMRAAASYAPRPQHSSASSVPLSMTASKDSLSNSLQSLQQARDRWQQAVAQGRLGIGLLEITACLIASSRHHAAVLTFWAVHACHVTPSPPPLSLSCPRPRVPPAHVTSDSW